MNKPMQVTYYQVVRDWTRPDGSRVLFDPISPPYAEPERAAAALEEARETFPDAYRMRASWFPQDEAERDSLIAELV